MGGLTSTLDTTGLPHGPWVVEVGVGENPVERHRFQLVAPSGER
jgi:hypothetical protein